MLKGISARPTRWSESKVTLMDYICLKNGKRCIMWDDEGEGFYLVCSCSFPQSMSSKYDLLIHILHDAADELGLD